MSELVNYETVATVYDSRYERNDYTGVERSLTAFVAAAVAERQCVLEVGCGTGHWLRFLEAAGARVVGLDRSAGMLAVAGASACNRLIRAQAESLPCQTGSCARIVCVNALHHFADPAAFFGEARRVLQTGGGVLTIGLDPHTGLDQWSIYDYFPTALKRDRERYLAAERIRELMRISGFSRCETFTVQHFSRELTVSEAARGGFLDRTSTSQLMVISDAEYETGLKRIRADDIAGPTVLRSDLWLYGTAGWTA